ncbi:MAG: hypothetical protein QOJ11_4384 [Frankiales bacterium]|jgi:hypothetical protein|nr:hypothetical protein [Frankiales bacterium]
MTETSDLPSDPSDGSDTEGGSLEEQELAGPGAGLSSVQVDQEMAGDGQPDDYLDGPN